MSTRTKPFQTTRPLLDAEESEREEKKNAHKQWLRHELKESQENLEEDLDSSLAHGMKKTGRVRTMSSSQTVPFPASNEQARLPHILEREPEGYKLRRRASHDYKPTKPREYLIDVSETQQMILEQEDTDGDCQITIHDAGPKVFKLGSLESQGQRKYDVRGTYALSVLLQELALAAEQGRTKIILEESRLMENPVDRLNRMIKTHFWDGLTRSIDAEGLEIICLDPKAKYANHRPRIYVPYFDKEQLEYWNQVACDKPKLNLQVCRLPEQITPQYVKSINNEAGILCLAMRKKEGSSKLGGIPFVVPGGRFNEMYGWDSYFEVLGLLEHGKIKVCKGMVENFVYQIKHYGKILNANRSYYLTRSQPPFLTDMALQIFAKLPSHQRDSSRGWLAQAMQSAIQEYRKVWMSEPRYLPSIGLSRYHAEGLGMPPETEATHFDAILKPYADRLQLSIMEYAAKYNSGIIKEPELDQYFVHDRTVRESGHDTTYRFEGKCANLCSLDLNSLLYKYEVDIAAYISEHCGGSFLLSDGSIEKSEDWLAAATKRKSLMNQYLWNEEEGLYFDFDIVENEQSVYESITTLWPLWAGAATADQAQRIVENLKKFEVEGGLVSGTEHSRGQITLMRPNRQWDYPYGWAPHQVMAWRALHSYGYEDVASRIAYRWLYTITKSFVDFNGTVPEKFDVVTMNHKVNVEYGNVGVDFKFIPREGFGWMNSSFAVGLTYLTTKMRRALGTLVPPMQLFDKDGRIKETARGGNSRSASPSLES